MLEFAIIIAAAVVFYKFIHSRPATPVAAAPPPLAPKRQSPQFVAAAAYADRLFAEKKWIAAEKAYVNVLKLDHKNLTAYSHLGIIYSTQKNTAEAIECFEIAVRLKPAAATYQNLALAYHENRNYMKAIAAFEKSIMFEPSANRYIGLSRSYKKISNTDQVLAALAKATALDASPKLALVYADALADAGRHEEAATVRTQAASTPPLHAARQETPETAAAKQPAPRVHS